MQWLSLSICRYNTVLQTRVLAYRNGIRVWEAQSTPNEQGGHAIAAIVLL